MVPRLLLNLFIVFSVWLIEDNHVDCYTSTQVKTVLANAPFSTYNSVVRPVADQSSAVEITVDLYFISINNFDNANSKLTSTSYLNVKWTDAVIAGTAWREMAVTEVTLPQNQIWIPDLAIKNSFTSLEGLGSNNLTLKIKPDGAVVWQPYEALETSCEVDVTYYPFDRTTCDLMFVIWSNPTAYVNARQGTVGINLDEYQESSEWSIVSTKTTDVSGTSTGVTFSIEVKRKPLHAVVNFLMPVILLAVVNTFVFVLPGGSGEKAGYVITAFLAFAVFFTIISAQLPKVSTTISVFGIYVFLMTLTSVFIALFTLLELRFFNRENKQPIPLRLQNFTRFVLRVRCQGCCRGRNVEPDGNIEAGLKEDITWQKVTDALDFIFFWGFLIIVILVTSTCVAISAVNG